MHLQTKLKAEPESNGSREKIMRFGRAGTLKWTQWRAILHLPLCAAIGYPVVHSQALSPPMVGCDADPYTFSAASQVGKLSTTWAALCRWCATKQIIVSPNASLGFTPDRGSGLVCVGAVLKKAAEIVRVPASAIISADNIENDSNIGHMIGPLRTAGLDDRGVVAVLDSRIVTKQYGSTLLNSMPPFYRTSDGAVIRDALKRLNQQFTEQGV